MIRGQGNDIVRHFARIASICIAALASVSQALAFNPDNAWTRAGTPLAAGPYASIAGANSGSGAPVYAPPPADPVAPGLLTIFDEVRLGATMFRHQGPEGKEDGAFITGEVLFKPVAGPFSNRFLDVLLTPRPDLGFSVSTEDGTDQVYGGFTWTVPLPWAFFLEASFGGTFHDGPLEGNDLSLGCRVLFRESLGAGVELGEHWRLIGGVDHSSHANLCGDENDGLTHFGGSIGYRF
jgi:lipid A 3-O-deacylase